jgi:hypothetical protein
MSGFEFLETNLDKSASAIRIGDALVATRAMFDRYCEDLGRFVIREKYYLLICRTDLLW